MEPILQNDTADPTGERPDATPAPQNQGEPAPSHQYYVRFRADTPILSATSRLAGLNRGEVVMIQTDHGPEPATVSGPGPDVPEPRRPEAGQTSYAITRRANREEAEKFENLVGRETEAFKTCQSHITRHRLEMKLIRVERYFNGSKIIFYFTAENRVDFRELVKDLVQEFRTRVEIRQIGVRHETKMIGGIGCCGRELCCATFINNFAPVSIKMAKEQNLPLNPAKISGVCNRLLCCLTYEYETYHALRKGMPKPGKTLVKEGVELKVIQTNVLKGTITVVPTAAGQEGLQVMNRAEWEPLMAQAPGRPAAQAAPAPGPDRKQAGAGKERNRRSKGRRRDNVESEQKGAGDEGSPPEE